jgi:hypothetical protein
MLNTLGALTPADNAGDVRTITGRARKMNPR